MESPIYSVKHTAYERQRDWDAQLQNSRQNERAANIETELATAAGHAKAGRYVAAYHGYLAVAENYHHPEAQ